MPAWFATCSTGPDTANGARPNKRLSYFVANPSVSSMRVPMGSRT